MHTRTGGSLLLLWTPTLNSALLECILEQVDLCGYSGRQPLNSALLEYILEQVDLCGSSGHQ